MEIRTEPEEREQKVTSNWKGKKWVKGTLIRVREGKSSRREERG